MVIHQIYASILCHPMLLGSYEWRWRHRPCDELDHCAEISTANLSYYIAFMSWEVVIRYCVKRCQVLPFHGILDFVYLGCIHKSWKTHLTVGPPISRVGSLLYWTVNFIFLSLFCSDFFDCGYDLWWNIQLWVVKETLKLQVNDSLIIWTRKVF